MTLGIARAADGKTDRRNAVAAGETRISKTAMRRPRNDKRRSDGLRCGLESPWVPRCEGKNGVKKAWNAMILEKRKEQTNG